MSKNKALARAAFRAKNTPKPVEPYKFPIKPPELPKNVIPKDAIAMDAAIDYQYLNNAYCGMGFPGYAYLAQLTTRAEFMRLTLSLSNELTRGGVEFTSKQDDDSNNASKIKAIEAEWKRLNVMGVMLQTAMNESYFGRGQMFVEIEGAKCEKALILSPNTIRKGSLNRITSIEPIWTTPSMYNASDPTAGNFYQPTEWYAMGKKIHASRLLTVITRPLPDILKPAFNFSGMSLSQMAEAYVDNWLRTRQSVSDLINQFSTTVLATSMGDILESAESEDPDAGNNLISRADLFTAMRSNKGLMLLDKEREELLQINTPLSGLDALQSQSQEQMCSVSRIPAIVFTGISPGGLNANSEGELKVFYDWIKSQQDAYWREPLEIILKLIQLSLFGEIDEDIGLNFVPLQQMTPNEKADIRFKDMQTDTGYINAGVIAGQEARVKLANDPDSGYDSIDTEIEIVPPNPDPFGNGSEKPPGDDVGDPLAKDSDFKESDHPRGKDGKFGNGSGGSVSPAVLSPISDNFDSDIQSMLREKFKFDSADEEGSFITTVKTGNLEILHDQDQSILDDVVKIRRTIKNIINLKDKGFDTDDILYHGGKNLVNKILSKEEHDKTFGLFDGLFFSDKESAESHGDKLTRILVKDKINHIPRSKETDAIIKGMFPHEDRDGYSMLNEVLVKNKSPYDLNEDEQKILGSALGFADIAEIDWSSQNYRGLIAKELGYSALYMNDEHGSWFIPFGSDYVIVDDEFNIIHNGKDDPFVNEQPPSDDSGANPFAKDSNFKESDHPRDKDGKFGSGGGKMKNGQIEYTFPKDFPIEELRGRTVKGGRFGNISNKFSDPVDAVRFPNEKSKNGQVIVARIKGKPELESAYEDHKNAESKVKEGREAFEKTPRGVYSKLKEDEFNAYDPDNSPGSARWKKHKELEDKVKAFEVENPELMEELRLEKERKIDRDYDDLSDFVKNGS